MKPARKVRFTNLNTPQYWTLKQICFDKYQDKISGQGRFRMGGFRYFQYKKLFVLRTIITEGNEEEIEKDPLEHSKLIKLAKRAVSRPV